MCPTYQIANRARLLRGGFMTTVGSKYHNMRRFSERVTSSRKISGSPMLHRNGLRIVQSPADSRRTRNIACWRLLITPDNYAELWLPTPTPF